MKISEVLFLRIWAKAKQIFVNLSVQSLGFERMSYIIFEWKRNIVSDEKWICQKIV